MPRYLLDTNVLSEALKRRPDPQVMDMLAAHESDLAIAAPVWHELRFGCERLGRSRHRRRIEAYLSDVVASIPVLPYDTEAAAWHAAERARLSRAGTTPPFIDGQIAAVAVVNRLTLVTANLMDFRRFQDLAILNWSRS